MSEVHRGLDTRLGRDVAVKVLRADLATIAERAEQEQIKPPAITVICAVAGLADQLAATAGSAG